MKCRDVMTMDLRWIRDTASIRDAALSMRDNSIGFLPVCDGQGTLVGVVTDRDLAIRGVADNRLPAESLVTDVMSRPAIVCLEDEPVRRAEQVMADHQISRLPVIGPANQVVGVISLADVVTRRNAPEALRTARGVLARDSGGPHQPIADIHLTPSVPGARGDVHFELPRSRTADEGRSVAVGKLPGMG
jgi:CBS domain-containing protein